MKPKSTSLPAFVSCFLIAAGAWIGTPLTVMAEEPLQVQSGWTYLSKQGNYGPFRQFRKYYFDGESLLNVIIFNCSKTEGNPYSNITFVLPKSYQIRSFPRKSWFPQFQFRVIINDGDSIGLIGEYRNGEIFFDRIPKLDDIFQKIILANSIDLAFGDENDIINYVFTEQVDAFLDDPEEQSHFTGIKGSSHFAKHEIFAACKRFQKR